MIATRMREVDEGSMDRIKITQRAIENTQRFTENHRAFLYLLRESLCKNDDINRIPLLYAVNSVFPQKRNGVLSER
jgi:hypothetical protein